MSSPLSARQALMDAAQQRILLTDGAWGTQIQTYALGEADYAGDLGLPRDQKGNNDILALTKPLVIEKIARAYLDAGSDIISTNTFSSTSISQADYGAEALVRDLNIANARITRRVADEYSARDGRRRFVAGAVGPTNKTLSLSPDVNDPGYREVDFDQLKAVYAQQIDALVEGGVDFILIETIFDTLNAKAGIFAVLDVATTRGIDLPIMLSMTLTDLSGRNLSGHSVEAFWYAVRHAKPLTVGLNCSFGATQLRPHVRSLSAIADCLLMVYPNAGLPNELGEYDELPAETAALVGEWATAGQVNILGGCCGSTPAHIAAMRDAIAGCAPRLLPTLDARTRLAGLDPFVMAA
ncbi:MAG: homocysteine S-methyltransferase family protein [Sphingomonadaceae bacterium]|nr:homocysteine S-methyltransferase family protein [Sphingomonadaceae bacterium]